MSDTPRTDAQLSTPKVVLTDGRYCYTEPWSGAVSADFARTLEREVDVLRSTLRIVLAHWPRQEVLDSLEPDNPEISRHAPLNVVPRTREVRQWREIADVSRGRHSDG